MHIFFNKRHDRGVPSRFLIKKSHHESSLILHPKEVPKTNEKKKKKPSQTLNLKGQYYA